MPNGWWSLRRLFSDSLIQPNSAKSKEINDSSHCITNTKNQTRGVFLGSAVSAETNIFNNLQMSTIIRRDFVLALYALRFVPYTTDLMINWQRSTSLFSCSPGNDKLAESMLVMSHSRL